MYYIFIYCQFLHYICKRDLRLRDLVSQERSRAPCREALPEATARTDQQKTEQVPPSPLDSPSVGALGALGSLVPKHSCPTLCEEVRSQSRLSHILAMSATFFSD